MGNYFDSNKTGNLDESQVSIIDPVSGQGATVTLAGGLGKLETNQTISVVTTSGTDPLPDNAFTVTNAGGIGDTFRVQIPATTFDPTSPDRDLPAIDVTTTITSSEAGDEVAAAQLIVDDLNADSNFLAGELKAFLIKSERAIVHITLHKKFSLETEFYERSNLSVDVTGSATVVILDLDGKQGIKSRNKPNSLGRDPDNPHRLGVQAISGSVSVTPGEVSDLFIENAKSSGSANLLVDGSSTPVNFTVPSVADKDRFVQELRFYGQGNGIKFGQFLSKSGAGGLTNGIQVTIKSDDDSLILPIYKTTEDFKNKFAFGDGSNFRIDVQSGKDEFIAIFVFNNPFPIRANGTFSTDDYVEVRIRDNLTSGVAVFEFLAFGFEREA